MRIRLRTTMAGPGGCYSSGQWADLPAPVARQLIEAGYADAVEHRPEPEAAFTAPAETASLSPPRPRRRRPRRDRASGES